MNRFFTNGGGPQGSPPAQKGPFFLVPGTKRLKA